MSLHEAELLALAGELEAAGLVEDSELLREVEASLEQVEHPPGLFSRVTGSMRQTVAQHWGNLVGELQESREAWLIVQRRVASNEPLTVDEADKVRAQMLDLFRMAPATMVVVFNATVPVPCTTLITPWLLRSLGLLPSQWREAHALYLLEQEYEHLTAVGQVDRAERVYEILEELEARSERRDALASRCALLTHWDANDNGAWDPEEEQEYAREVGRLQQIAADSAHEKRWFLQLHDHIFGPVRHEDLPTYEPDGLLLVCFDGASGWVALADLLAEEGEALLPERSR